MEEQIKQSSYSHDPKLIGKNKGSKTNKKLRSFWETTLGRLFMPAKKAYYEVLVIKTGMVFGAWLDNGPIEQSTELWHIYT